MGELLDDADGALWNRAMLDEGRVSVQPELRRVLVAVDPAGGASRTSDETGIVAAGWDLTGGATCSPMRAAATRRMAGLALLARCIGH